MLILILIDVHHSQKAVFGLEKGSNCQNHSSSGSLHLVTPHPTLPHPRSKISDSPHPLALFGKPCFISVPKQKDLLAYTAQLPNQMNLFGKQTWEGYH